MPPVLVVQHMPPVFTQKFAERLNGLCAMQVKEAKDGDVVKSGQVLIAPGDYHMLVERTGGYTLKIKLTKWPPVGGHRPSVDVMMESLSETGLKNIAAVIMTGMGADGKQGICRLKENNEGYIIAQDEASCVVYGMPKSAVQTGIVDVVVPLKDIADEIKKFTGVF
jgi:two-component system chemotaxis response regulator CheB